MQEASDAHSKTADSDTVSTYQVSSVQLVTDKKTELKRRGAMLYNAKKEGSYAKKERKKSESV